MSDAERSAQMVNWAKEGVSLHSAGIHAFFETVEGNRDLNNLYFLLTSISDPSGFLNTHFTSLDALRNLIINSGNKSTKDNQSFVDTALQSLAIAGLSIFADMIRNGPRDAVGIGLGNINNVSYFLSAKCSNKDDPELSKAIAALDSALLSVDQQILEAMSSSEGSLTTVFNPLAAKDPALRDSLAINLSVWIILRNLRGQPEAGLTVAGPALGGQ